MTQATPLNRLRATWLLQIILIALLLIPCMSNAQALTGEVQNAQWGLSFTMPEGWIGQQGQAGYVFGSQTERGFILVMPHEFNSLDELRAEAQKGLNDGYGTQLQVRGPIQPFGERGLGAELSGVVEGQQAQAYAVSVLAPHGGGVTVLTAVEPEYYTTAYADRVEAIAESIRFTEPQAPAVAGDWNARLKGSRLTYLYSYYSGGVSGSYAGASEETVIDLCTAGHFFYSGSSSFAVDGGVGGDYNASGYSGGSDQGSGQWQVVKRDNQPVLQLTFQNGEVAEYAISYPDEELHLDGKRFFWTTHNSPADYRPQCP